MTIPKEIREQARGAVEEGWNKDTSETDQMRDLAVALTQNVVDSVASLLHREKQESEKEGYERGVKAAREAAEDFLKRVSDTTFKKTMLGKSSPLEVTDDDWQRCSFSFDDILSAISSLLKDKPV